MCNVKFQTAGGTELPGYGTFWCPSWGLAVAESLLYGGTAKRKMGQITGPSENFLVLRSFHFHRQEM